MENLRKIYLPIDLKFELTSPVLTVLISAKKNIQELVGMSQIFSYWNPHSIPTTSQLTTHVAPEFKKIYNSKFNDEL